jgi:hypothetical protein
MPTLKIDQIKPGMVLAAAVYNHQKVLLLDSGRKISEKHIRVFKSWGVAEVPVRGKNDKGQASTGESGGSSRDYFERELQQKFSEVLDDPVMTAIMQAACNQLIKQRQKQDESNGNT